MSEKGFFITFEGGEGSGKSSQLKKLAGHFETLGNETVITREPGGTVGAEALRHVLLSGHARELGAEAEAILFAAARADHMKQVIKPALAAGKTVLSDRFFDSTRAYQGVDHTVSPGLLDDLETLACGPVRPDLTFILDLEPEIALSRADARRANGETPDRFEKEALNIQKARRDAFLRIAEREPNRCVVIDGSGNLNDVSKRILEALNKRLPQLSGPVRS